MPRLSQKNRRLSKQERKRKDALSSMEVPPSRKATVRQRFHEQQCGSSSRSSCSAAQSISSACSSCPSRSYSSSGSSCSSRYSSASKRTTMDNIEVILEAPSAIITTVDVATPQEESTVSSNQEDVFSLFGLSPVSKGFAVAVAPESSRSSCSSHHEGDEDSPLSDDRQIHTPTAVSPETQLSCLSNDFEVDEDEEEDDDQDKSLTLYAELERLGQALGLADAPHCCDEARHRESEEEKEEIESPEMEEEDYIIGYLC